MLGSGVVIGIIAVTIQFHLVLILQVLLQALTACCAVATGPASLGTVVFHIVSTTTLTSGTATSAAAWLFSLHVRTSHHYVS